MRKPLTFLLAFGLAFSLMATAGTTQKQMEKVPYGLDLQGNPIENVSGVGKGTNTAPVVRTATVVVAAADAATAAKAQADYVCDGTADDEQIQNAIDSLPPRGHLSLSKGNFDIGSTLTVTKPIMITGQGIRQTNLVLADNVDSSVISLSPSSTKRVFVLKDFTIKGNKTNNTGGDGIYWNSNALWVMLDHIEVYNPSDDGLHSPIGPMFVSNVKVSGAANEGIDLDGGGGQFVNCRVNDSGGTNWTLDGTEYLIVNSIAEGGGKYGMRLSGADRSIISNCFIDRAYRHGLYLYNTDDAVVTGNVVTRSNQEGFSGRTGIVLGGNVGSFRNTVTSNIANNVTTAGINPGDADYGIVISSGSENNVVKNNQVADVNIKGIRIDNENNLVEDNEGYMAIGETRTYAQTVNYNDTSPVTAATVDDGYAVEDVWVEITTAWDGTGASIDIGDGVDVDGFLPTASISEASVGYYGTNHSDRGVYLWDATNGSDIEKVYTAPDTIDVTFTPGTGATQGQAIIYVKITRIGG